jgi:phenylalanine-4-hydroxylase
MHFKSFSDFSYFRDIVHELMGHAPMFANPDFADFSQEIGLASLGASDEQIVKLGRVYWYTVEFGLCTERGKRKAIGAGLLSSFGELEYSMGAEPTVLPWDPYDASERDYPISNFFQI